jgi:hypothetical protein
MDLTYQTSVERDRKKRLVQCLGGLSAVLKGNLSTDALRVWEHLLRPYPVEVIEVASLKLAQTATFMPVPAEMIEACKAEAARREMAALRARCNIDQLLEAGRTVPPELSDGSQGAAQMVKSLTGKLMPSAIDDYERRAAELRRQAQRMREEAQHGPIKG